MSKNIFISIKRLKSALFSRHPAAYVGIIIKVEAFFSQPLDKLINIAIGNRQKENLSIPPCLMIVSPPRSGSTIVYQVLTRTIPCLYISNYHALFPYSASRLFRKKLDRANEQKGYNNYYGYTSRLSDVNEGNHILDFILEKSTDISELQQKFISLCQNMCLDSHKPLIFKNVKHYKNIYKFHKAIPQLKFLRLKRNTEHVIQSVLKAFYELGNFNPMPEPITNMRIINPVEIAVRQVLEIEQTLSRQLKEIPENNKIEITYEEFCMNTTQIVEKIANEYLNIDIKYLNYNALIPPLKISNRSKVNAQDENEIRSLINTIIQEYEI